MEHSGGTHLDKVCDICGDAGFRNIIHSCSQCKLSRHPYCMRVVVRDVLEDWKCEECLSSNDIHLPNSGQAENGLHSCGNVCLPLGRGRQVACKRQKAIETGKVKFLPTEEVMKLSSGYSKPAFPSNTNSRPKHANINPSPSKRTSMGSRNVCPSSNPINVKKNPTFLDLGSVPPKRRDLQIKTTSISRQHAAGTLNKAKEDEEKASRTLAKKPGSKEEPVSSVIAANGVKSNVDAKAMTTVKATPSVSATKRLCPSIVNTESAHVPNKENVYRGKISDTIRPDQELPILHDMTKEDMRSSRPSLSRQHTSVISSGQIFHEAAEPEECDVPITETWNRHKVSLYRQHAPSLYAIWTGGFKFFNTATPGEFYGGFLARPPCRIHSKAYKLSKKMPPVLQVKLLRQCQLPADIFQNGCLDLCGIALYFLPADYMQRSEENYNQLCQLLEMENSAMISYIDGTELFIFTSKQLHADSQGVFNKSNMDFFAGVFRCAKKNRMKIPREVPSLVAYTDDGNGNTNNAEVVDMDIDMIGGKIVGIPDMALSKAPTPGFTERASKETSIAITDGKFSSLSADLDSIKDDTSQGSLNQHQVKRRELSQDVSQISLSCSVMVKAEVQDGVNDCSATCPRSLNTGTKSGIQIKVEERDEAKPDEIREKEAGPSNDLCTIEDEAKMHATFPSKIKTSLCFGLFPSTGVRLSVAGRSLGDPVVASVGGLIRDELGKWIAGYNLKLGISNGLATDLRALYHGMKFSRDRGYKRVWVESDSAAAVESLKRAPSHLNPNRALIEGCRSLINGEWDCKVHTIQREENMCAEWLATHADGVVLGLSIINLPPLELIPFLEDDYKRIGQFP